MRTALNCFKIIWKFILQVIRFEILSRKSFFLFPIMTDFTQIEIWYFAQIEIGDFLTFADFFLDGFVTDYLVQSKIRDAREDIEVGILHVRTILEELYRKLEV